MVTPSRHSYAFESYEKVCTEALRQMFAGSFFSKEMLALNVLFLKVFPNNKYSFYVFSSTVHLLS